MVRLASFGLLLCVLPLAAQPTDAPEAFTFDPQPAALTEGPEREIPQAIAYSPDGKIIALGDEAGGISLWSVGERKKLGALAGHTAAVFALAWSKDGTRLASASRDKSAIVWDVEAHKPLHKLAHPGPVYAVAVSLDGKTVATGGFDKIVRLWNAETGEALGKREGHTASVRGLAFRSDGGQLVSGGADYAVVRWSTGDASSRELRGHTRGVRAVAYLPDGGVASASDDGRVIVWGSDGEPRHTFGPYPDGVPAIAASPRGTFLVAALPSGKAHVLDPTHGLTRAVLAASDQPLTAVAISPDGRQVATAGFDRVVRLWSAGAKPAEPAVTFSHSGPVRAAAVSSDGVTVATGDEAGTIRLFHAVTGRETASWPAHKGAVEDLAFNGDGSALISGGSDGVAIVWRPATKEQVHRLGDHPGPVRRVALSNSGTLAATGSADNDVRVFDLKAGGDARRLNVESPPTAIQFLNDDSLLTAGGPRAFVWDVATARVADTIDGGQFAQITGAAATGDGKLTALAGDPLPGSQRPEDVGNSRVLAVSRHLPTTSSQRMHDTGVGIARLTVSPAGSLIAAVGADGTVRVWDWPGLPPIRKFAAHAAAVPALAISARGEFVVTASADGTARRWAASRGEPLVFAAKLLDESKQAWFARVSPDGKVLITGGDDKVLRIRDGVPGVYADLSEGLDCAFTAVVSPDGSLLATGHLGGEIRVWDLKTRKQLKKLEGDGVRIWALAFSPDGSRLVSGGGSWEEPGPGVIRVWDTAMWKTETKFQAHDDLVFDVAVSPDGKQIASCSRDQTVRTWELATGKPGHVMRMHAGHVRSVAYTKDGSRLYSGGLDGRLQWWDPATGKPIDGKPLGVRSVQRVRLSPDGKSLLLALNPNTNVGYAAIWDIEKNEVVRRFPPHEGQVNNVAWSPDGRTVVSVGGRYSTSPRVEPGPIGPWVVAVNETKEGKPITRSVPVSEIRCWDAETGSPLAALPGHKYWLETVAFTKDGSHLITAGGTTEGGELRVWDFAGVRPAAALPAKAVLTCGRFSPDGSVFATGGADGAVVLWDVAKALRGDGAAGTAIPAHTGLVRDLAWFPDGSRLVSSGEDGKVMVFDVKTAKPILSFDAADRAVGGIAVSPDGSMIATASGGWKDRRIGTVRVWDAAKGTELFALPDISGPAWGVAFTRDGRLIVTHLGNPAVRVFDVKERKLLKTLTAATEGRGLALSPDEKWFGITAHGNGLVKIWETATGREAFELTAHPGKVVFTVDFAADGQTVVTAGGDASAVVWKMPGGAWKVPGYVPPAPPKSSGPFAPPQLEKD